MRLARPRSPFRTRSLAARLFLIGISASVLSVLLTAGGFLTYELLQFRATLTSKLKSVADIFAVNNTAPLSFGDAKAARENLSALKVDRHMVAACLYDRAGNVFASYARSGSPHSCPASANAESGLVFDSGNACFFSPILLDHEVLGTLFLAHDLDDERARMRR